VPTIGEAGLSEMENVSVFVLLLITCDVDATAGSEEPFSKNNEPARLDWVGP
jgi:hypothetical protein